MSKANDISEWGQYQPQRKNLIINGGFNVWQRGTLFSPAVSADYTSDRWLLDISTSGTLAVQKATIDSLKGQQYYFRVATTTSDASPSVVNIGTIIEGYDSQTFGWENTVQSDKQDITISFWTAHTKTGTNCVSVRNGAVDRSYVAEYTQVASDAWEYHTITIPAPTDGVWLVDNDKGLHLDFILAAASGLQTTVNTWTVGNKIGTSAQVNHLDSTSNIFRISGIQLEVGPEATDFEIRHYGDELALCQRYYEKSYDTDVDPGTNTFVGSHYETTENGISTGAGYNNVSYRVTKRSAPTVLIYAVDGTLDNISDGTNTARSIGAGSFSTSGGVSGFNQNYTLSSPSDDRRVFHWTADAEL